MYGPTKSRSRNYCLRKFCPDHNAKTLHENMFLQNLLKECFFSHKKINGKKLQHGPVKELERDILKSLIW